jgi:hypothetical protein
MLPSAGSKRTFEQSQIEITTTTEAVIVTKEADANEDIAHENKQEQNGDEVAPVLNTIPVRNNLQELPLPDINLLTQLLFPTNATTTTNTDTNSIKSKCAIVNYLCSIGICVSCMYRICHKFELDQHKMLQHKICKQLNKFEQQLANKHSCLICNNLYRQFYQYFSIEAATANENSNSNSNSNNNRNLVITSEEGSGSASVLDESKVQGCQFVGSLSKLVEEHIPDCIQSQLNKRSENANNIRSLIIEDLLDKNNKMEKQLQANSKQLQSNSKQITEMSNLLQTMFEKLSQVQSDVRSVLVFENEAREAKERNELAKQNELLMFSRLMNNENEFRKIDRKSTRLNSSHDDLSRMPSSA